MCLEVGIALEVVVKTTLNRVLESEGTRVPIAGYLVKAGRQIDIHRSQCIFFSHERHIFGGPIRGRTDLREGSLRLRLVRQGNWVGPFRIGYGCILR